jgi:UDP-N-acetylmuramoyl-L-alanyl-D-glutamate--2,6-diaminopimelate ligase
MQLGELFYEMTLPLKTAAIEVTSVTIDSRTSQPNSLFFAMPGTLTDGTFYASEAVANGAVAVVSPKPLASEVPVIVVPVADLPALLGRAAAMVTDWPDRELSLVGITGTNGKTSVATMVADLVNLLGWNGASMGTLTNVRTTPAAPELWRELRRIRDSFGNLEVPAVVALEVSSHALAQQRTAGAHFTVAAFTNLSHDHLDYHGDMERYFEAKSSLFTPDNALQAVIWVDDPYGARLAASTELAVTAVSRTDASDVQTSLSGSTFFWRGHVIFSPLVGDYNVDNALVAMAIVSRLGADDAVIASAMGSLQAVPGRFEVIQRGDPTVVIDYAHTPEGLRRLLASVRTMTKGRVFTVFGCGGDRDKGKRSVMGEVATELSDLTLVTSDNPRSEDPDAIIDEIVADLAPACYERLRDRRAAITRALTLAERDDVVVIAGKGHEVTQTIGEHVVAFSDRDVVREVLK